MKDLRVMFINKGNRTELFVTENYSLNKNEL